LKVFEVSAESLTLSFSPPKEVGTAGSLALDAGVGETAEGCSILSRPVRSLCRERRCEAAGQQGGDRCANRR
jgi:hypothetical protein